MSSEASQQAPNSATPIFSLDEALVRAYEFTYLDERVVRDGLVKSLSPQNGAALLSQMEVIGHDRAERLPPLVFAYTPFEPAGRRFFAVQGRGLPARSLADRNLELVDLFGNGLPDVLETGVTMRYWRNLGGGRFDLPRDMRDAPAGLALADPGVQIVDATGDGRPDLLVTREALSGYYPTRPGGAWDRRSFQRYEVAPGFNLDDPEVQLVDLDGDGVTDAIRTGVHLECFFNHPQEGWHKTRRVDAVLPDLSLSDPRVRWADMAGDGLQDLVLVHDGMVEYWPNLGHGNWGQRIQMQHSPRFPFGFDPERVLLGDVDGDGLADLVYVDHGNITLWINQGGSAWSDPIIVRGTPPVTSMDAIRLVDLLGTGIAGILWSSDAGGTGREHLFFLDFTGGVKPYLLAEMDNRIGAVTRVEYAPSTRFYLADERQPAMRWRSTLPFPVQVVARVEVVDALSGGKLTTEYSYHHGYWDGADREFRGFGRVDQRDTEMFECYHAPGLHPEHPFAAVESRLFSPPTETRTWFHQGPVGPEFGDWEEADYGHEYWPGDPQLLAHTEQAHAFLGGDGRASVQAQPTAYLDETGWREGQERAWLWTAVTAWVTVFVVRLSRSSKVAQELLGDRFWGWLVTDRWSAYPWYPTWRRQVCWAHLLRDIEARIARGGGSQEIGEALRAQARLMFHWWHRVRDGTLAHASFATYMRPIRRAVERLLEAGQTCGVPKTEGVCREICKVRQALWTFVRHTGVEPTNNVAERAIRAGVLWRKGSFGTQSAEGSRFAEAMMTVVATLKQQHRNVLDYVTAACEAALHGEPAPSLLPLPTDLEKAMSPAA